MPLIAAERLCCAVGWFSCRVGVKIEFEILCLGVNVKKNKRTCSSSLESPMEVPDSGNIAAAFVK